MALKEVNGLPYSIPHLLCILHAPLLFLSSEGGRKGEGSSSYSSYIFPSLLFLFSIPFSFLSGDISEGQVSRECSKETKARFPSLKELPHGEFQSKQGIKVQEVSRHYSSCGWSGPFRKLNVCGAEESQCAGVQR